MHSHPPHRATVVTRNLPSLGARLTIALLLVGWALAGCGVKGPPIPPQRPPLPVVADLSYRIAEPSVILSWRIKAPLAVSRAGRSAFGVLRSRNALDAPLCETCPLVFEKVATVPYADAPALQFSTALPLDKGYRYRFKVRLETGPVTGADSEPVQFDYPAGASAVKESP